MATLVTLLPPDLFGNGRFVNLSSRLADIYSEPFLVIVVNRHAFRRENTGRKVPLDRPETFRTRFREWVVAGKLKASREIRKIEFALIGKPLRGFLHLTNPITGPKSGNNMRDFDG
jgi:hypothetical protein